MQDGERGQRLEAVSETSARAESGHKLLWNGFDVADDRGFADGTRRLKDQSSKGGGRDPHRFRWKHDCHGKDTVGYHLKEAHVEEA